MELTRKELLQASAGAVAVAGMASVAVADEGKPAWEPEAWSDEADLIVVGYGGAGVCAAITGLDAGASVIVLEKAPAREGGNTACSGGQIHEVCPDVDEWYEMYVHGAYGVAADERTAKAYMELVNQTPDWFDESGIPCDWTETKGDGFKTPPMYLMGTIAGRDGKVGLNLFQALDEAATSRGVDVRLSTSGKRLIQNPLTKEILGVIAEGPDGEELTFKANKGVLLCCGGYENNPELQGNFFQPGVRFFPIGTPYNSGDGFAMATEVGAMLWHMGLMEYTSEMYKVPSELANMGVRVQAPTNAGYLWVDRKARRFVNEKRGIVHSHPLVVDFDYDDKAFDYTHKPIFLVFDQAMFDEINPLWDPTGMVSAKSSGYTKACMAQNPNPQFGIEWPNNDYAVEQGWIFKGETIEELAAAIRAQDVCGAADHAIEGLDAEILKATVEQYNAYCEAGADADFARKPETLIPLATPPFYAIEIANGIMNTNGGPRRNEYSQTLNAYGDVIPRLYTCGEFGSFNGMLYNCGNVMEALTTGRCAAAHAAALEPWA